MANWQINQMMEKRQVRVFLVILSSLFLILAMVAFLLVDPSGKKQSNKAEKPINITGVVEESFTKAVDDNVYLRQQTELESLKKLIVELGLNLQHMDEDWKKELSAQKVELIGQVTTMVKESESQERTKVASDTPSELKKPELWHAPNSIYAMNTNTPLSNNFSDARPTIHTVSFRSKQRKPLKNYLNPANYVPSNTSVRAVILGGADADASVNSQSKNNGVMLFKFIEDGTLPNGGHSHLAGCRVSGNSYGDISSERAFATLYRLSCARPGQPIIDREVTGWIFFNGKVGIKGVPLMRDNKIMAWAGVSGALSGIAQAAQYAQSVQNIGPYSASSIVPSKQIAPFAAYGGASKAADTLSQYYVKRAEQYHPVIQIGAGNVVTVVFKEGFYLEPDEKKEKHDSHNHQMESNSDTDMNFTVPPEVLGKIDQANTLNQNKIGDLE